jgi:hypothetical protein
LNAQEKLLHDAATALGITATLHQEAFGQSVLRIAREDKSAWIIDGHICSGTDLADALLIRHKHTLKCLVAPLGLPAPKGIAIHISDSPDDEWDKDLARSASAFIQSGRTYICKPAFIGRGNAIAQVQDPTALASHLNIWRTDIADFVLEEKCDGHPLALLVLAGNIIAARVQKPRDLVGDGNQSLEELIASHNATSAPQLTIVIDTTVRQLLRDQRCYLSEVIPAGQRIIIGQTDAAISNDDMLTSLHPAYHAWASQIASLVHAPMIQIGLLTTDPSADPIDHAVVLKVDPNPEWLDFAGQDGGTAIATALLEKLL